MSAASEKDLPLTSPSLPSGTLTFLFTDVEGSTRLWEQHPVQMSLDMARHDVLIESCVAQHNGVIVRPRGEGDSRFAVFPEAVDAIAAASAIQHSFSIEAWSIPAPLRVRIALHTGEADLRDGDYYGQAVNRCAKLRNAAYGGQTLISQATYHLVRQALPDGVSLRDLGEHHLKDLQQPERLYQLIIAGTSSDFPPLKMLESLHTNLPAALTSFIGREKEIVEVKQLLADGRLLTITGSGGAGKTRLALQVARDLLNYYPDGVWLVELAPLTNPALVPQFVAEGLSIREEKDRPLDVSLIEHLRSRTALLVLDNCEHLVQDVARLVERILRSAPDLCILATSREALGLPGETTWRIPSLSTPDLRDTVVPEKLVAYEAVKLFVERAVSVKPDFTITQQNGPSVAKICARLDGIPLAIELAAARVRVLSVEEIAARLDDRFRLLIGGSRTALPRQQTLRALINWSYELLSEAERTMLRRLSVFVGGWTLQAAEQVCSGGSIEEWEVLDLLTRLIDKSLVVAETEAGSERYRFLETIRQFAGENLRESGEADELAHKHAMYFLGVAEESYGELWGPKQGLWLERLEAEHENLRTALEWAMQAHGREEFLLRMAGSLWRFWEIHGYIREGRSWLESALVSYPDAPPGLIANGLRGAGSLARQQGDYTQASEMHERSLALFRQLDDKFGIARELESLGQVSHYQGNYSQAVELHTEALALRYEIGDQEGIAMSLAQLATIALDRGQYPHARDLLEESLKLNRLLGNRLHIALSLNDLGVAAYLLCEYGRAHLLFEEALSLYQELKDKLGISDVLLNLGNLAKDQGYFRRALQLYGECLELKEGLGDRRGFARVIVGMAEVALTQGNYARAAQFAEQSLMLCRELGLKRGVINALEVRAFVAHYQGEHDLAASLADEGLELATEINAPRGMGYSKALIGLNAYAQGHFKQAKAKLEEALAIFRTVNDQRNVAHMLVSLARTAYRQGDRTGAGQYLQESLSISRRLDIRWTLALSLEIMGLLERSQGYFDRATELFRESLHLSAEQDNLQGVLNCLGAIAGLAAMADQPVRAARLFAAAERLRQEIGARMGRDDREEYEDYLAMLRHKLPEAALNAAWSEGSAMTMEQAIGEVDG